MYAALLKKRIVQIVFLTGTFENDSLNQFQNIGDVILNMTYQLFAHIWRWRLFAVYLVAEYEIIISSNKNLFFLIY